MASRILTALFACIVLGGAPADAGFLWDDRPISPWCDQEPLWRQSAQKREMCLLIRWGQDRAEEKDRQTAEKRVRQAQAAEAETKQPSEQECRDAYRAGCFAVLHRREVTAPVAPPPCKWCR